MIYDAHAAVVYLYGLFFHYFVQFILRWTTCFYQFEEFIANVCTDVFAAWWIEPWDISLSTAFLCCVFVVVSFCASLVF